MSFKVKLVAFYKNYSQLVYIILIPLLASILPIINQTKQASCGFVLIVMAGYWISECMPIAIVSLLPIPLFPLFGIMRSKEISQIYFSDILMLFFGGLCLAICVESSGLHKKIAFRAIMFFGSNPVWLLLGIMSITGFLSLWISNVASASMMLPVIVAMVKELAKLDPVFRNPDDNSLNTISTDNHPVEISEANKSDDLPDTKAARNLMKCFLMCLSYSSSIGGSGSIVGTAPNLILKGFFDQNYPDAGLNFVTFMLYSTPCGLLMVTISWLLMMFIWLPKKYFIGCIHKFKVAVKRKEKTPKDNKLHDFICHEYTNLGSFNWEQVSVGVIFILLVLLWITRDLHFAPGWGDLFLKGYPTDTTAAIFILLLLVAWPKENIFKGRPYTHLIGWKKINDEFPWNVIILSGGGLALAAGFNKSGLSESIGEYLKTILPDQKELALLVMLIFTLTFTEFTSNTSTASILIPIADAIARKAGMSPVYLLMPLTVGTSFSFMLPIATPTNAIVFGSGYLTIRDMIISGFFLNITGVFVLLFSSLWATKIFHMVEIVTPTNSTIFNGTYATMLF